jgi:hypothetical protein
MCMCASTVSTNIAGALGVHVFKGDKRVHVLKGDERVHVYVQAQLAPTSQAFWVPL